MAKKKKLRTRKKKEKETMYVRIDHSVMLRKEILETAIEIANLIKRWEGYKVLREKKLQQIKVLKKLMSDIEKEFRSFNRDLPKVEIEKVDKEVKEGVEVSVKKREISTIDKDLEELKAKLAQLRV